MRSKTDRKAPLMLGMVVLALGIMLFILVPEPLSPGEITSDPKSNEELDPAIHKLLEVDADDVISIHIERDVVPGLYEISDPDIIERIVTNLNSISTQECEADSWYSDNRGYFLKIDRSDGVDTFTFLGGNQSGVQVIGLEPLNTKVVEVVEGDLDYDYIQEVYKQYAN